MPAYPISPSKPRRPYTIQQIRLHWAVAVLVGVQWWAGESMHQIMGVLEAQGSLGFGQFLVSTLHSFGGFLILALVFWRLRIRWQQRTAGRQLADTTAPWWQRLAKLNHYCLYALLGLMVVSGALSYYQLLPVAGFHGYCGAVLKTLVFLHVVAALYHHFVRKDGVLAGIWFEKVRR